MREAWREDQEALSEGHRHKIRASQVICRYKEKKKSTMSRMSGNYIPFHFEVAIEGNAGLQHPIH
jgi:hypothetical protein